jgi:hypothetical protein
LDSPDAKLIGSLGLEEDRLAVVLAAFYAEHEAMALVFQ